MPRASNQLCECGRPAGVGATACEECGAPLCAACGPPPLCLACAIHELATDSDEPAAAPPPRRPRRAPIAAAVVVALAAMLAAGRGAAAGSYTLDFGSLSGDVGGHVSDAVIDFGPLRRRSGARCIRRPPASACFSIPDLASRLRLRMARGSSWPRRLRRLSRSRLLFPPRRTWIGTSVRRFTRSRRASPDRPCSVSQGTPAPRDSWLPAGGDKRRRDRRRHCAHSLERTGRPRAAGRRAGDDRRRPGRRRAPSPPRPPPPRATPAAGPLAEAAAAGGGEAEGWRVMDAGEPRPLTVSDVYFYAESSGTCPDCGQAGVELGRVNLTDPRRVGSRASTAISVRRQMSSSSDLSTAA